MNCLSRINNNSAAIECCKLLKSDFESFWPEVGCNCNQFRVEENTVVFSQAGEALQAVMKSINRCADKAKQNHGNRFIPLQYCEEEKEREGLEQYWPDQCSCTKLDNEIGVLNPKNSEDFDIIKDTERIIEHCIKIAKSAKAENEQRANAREATAVDITAACDDESGVYNCCKTKRNFYGNFWPPITATACDCDNISTELRMSRGGQRTIYAIKEELIECIEKADKQAKRQCGIQCEHYVDYSTKGCPEEKSNLKDRCGDLICASSAELGQFIKTTGNNRQNPNYLNIYNLFENAFDRDSCFINLKKKFISAYKSKCLDLIKTLQEEKKQTLLCDKNATKENTQCNKYCEDKAEGIYGDDPNPNANEIVKAVYDKMLEHDF